MWEDGRRLRLWGSEDLNIRSQEIWAYIHWSLYLQSPSERTPPVVTKYDVPHFLSSYR